MPRLRPNTDKYEPSVREAVREAHSALLVAKSLTGRHYKKTHEVRQRMEKLIKDFDDFQSLVLDDFEAEQKKL